METLSSPVGGRSRSASLRCLWILPVLYLLVGSVLQAFHHAPVAGTVENDWKVYRALAETWASATRVGGFYPVGYPVLLHALGSTLGDFFLAARILATMSAAGVLLAAGLFGRRWWGTGPALGLQLLLASNIHLYLTGLLVGTTAPCAALVLLAALAMDRWLSRPPTFRGAVVAGLALGLPALFRHTAVVLLPAGVLVAAFFLPRPRPGPRRRFLLACGLVVGWVAVLSPQLGLSWRQQGTLFHQNLARNVWLAQQGEIDFSRWSEAPADLGLVELVAADPLRVLTHVAGESVRGAGRLVWMAAGIAPPYMLRRLGGPLPLGAILVSAAAWAAFVLGRLAAGRKALWPRWEDRAAFPLTAAIIWVGTVSLFASAFRFLVPPWLLLAALAAGLGAKPESGGIPSLRWRWPLAVVVAGQLIQTGMTVAILLG